MTETLNERVARALGYEIRPTPRSIHYACRAPGEQDWHAFPLWDQDERLSGALLERMRRSGIAIEEWRSTDGSNEILLHCPRLKHPGYRGQLVPSPLSVADKNINIARCEAFLAWVEREGER